jgi:Holliday junction resolvase RusA-like endonuclease
MEIVAFVEPVGKPRMTQRDKWAKRPAVLKYRHFCDLLRQYVKTLPPSFAVDFHISMPKSWSQKKKDAMNGTPHQQKPDVDNLQKSLFDAVCEDDSYIWNVHARKFWATTGSIFITSVDQPSPNETLRS